MQQKKQLNYLAEKKFNGDPFKELRLKKKNDEFITLVLNRIAIAIWILFTVYWYRNYI